MNFFKSQDQINQDVGMVDTQGQIYIYRYSSTTIVNLSIKKKRKKKIYYLKGYYHGFEE